MGSPKILYVDIETAPIIAAIWEPFEANAIWVERDTFLLSVAFKWSHQKKVHTCALPDYAGYNADKSSDARLITDLWHLLNEADVVIAHNGDAFDIKKINSRFIIHGLKPPSPYKTIDTLKIARKVGKFDSNKLDNLGRYLGEGRKIPNSGAHLWRACCNGDPKAWRTMRRYNAQDVALLERVYERLKPWHQTHPNLTAYRDGIGCPACQSHQIQRRGFNVAKSRKTERFHCQSCGHWFSGKTVNETKVSPNPPARHAPPVRSPNPRKPRRRHLKAKIPKRRTTNTRPKTARRH